MMLRSLVGILVAALLGLLAPTNVARANLITNPGFETGDFSGWIRFGFVTPFDVVDGFAHTGNFAASLAPGGGTSLGFLSQTLATTPGQGYDLSFFLAIGGSHAERVQVSWNGSVISDQTFFPLFGYTEFDFLNLPATSPTTPLVLGFGTLFLGDPNVVHLDDVAVNPTPEPTTLLLLGTTAAGLGLARWRRRRPN